MEIVRSIHAAWEQGDFSSSDWASPEIEFVDADGIFTGSGRGRAAMARAWGGWLSGWEFFRVVADEYRELDGGRILVLTQFGGRGKSSGLQIGETKRNVAALFHLEDLGLSA